MESRNNSRRNFLKQNALTGMSAVLLGSFDDTKRENVDNKFGKKQSRDEEIIGMIGGMKLEQLRDQYRAELFHRFLPNMDNSVVDHQYGGFMCTVDIRTGEVLSTDKRAWYEGRGMWVYSYLYNNLERNPRFLEIARKSKDFILKHQPSEDLFWDATYSREGLSLSGPGDIYGSLFIAEGLAEYSRASGERKYFELAKKIVLNCVKRYDRPDYEYHIKYLSPAAPNYPGPRVLGHWMVLLRFSTQLLEHESDPEIEYLAERCVDSIMNYHLNLEFSILNEGINHDMSIRKDEFGNFSEIGHAIETLWMVMFESARKKDVKLFQKAQELFKRHVNVAHDTIYGGYFHSLDDVNLLKWKVNKVLWLQEEVLVGTLFLMEHKADEWAEKCFSETFAYVQEKFSFPSFKFWTETGDRKVNNYQTNRVEHYHHPRHLMINLLALERMIKRGGKASGVFG